MGTIRQTRVVVGLAAALAAAQCAPAGAQLFERTDTQKEVELGRQAAREVEKEAPLSTNRAYQERVQRIGSALVESLPDKPYSFQFKVLALPDVNAFALPGGPVYVFEGLLARMPDDNEVAFVLGHELTHATHRHWARHTNKMQSVGILSILASVATGNSTIPQIVEEMVSLQYSRDEEAEADRGGMEYMWTAGFDPQGAVDAMKVLATLDEHNKAPEWLMNHPKTSDRLKKLEAMRDELKSRPRPTRTQPAALAAAGLDVAAMLGTLPTAATAPNPWFPLAVGNEWTYAIGSGTDRPAYTLRVVSEVRSGAVTAYRATTSFGRDDGAPCLLLTSDTDVWRRNRPGVSTSAWQPEFSLGAVEGQSVTRAAKTYVVQRPEPVNAPCGAFSDVRKLRVSDGKDTYDVWFARGVGMVKRVCVETGVSETLVKYKVQGAQKPPAPAPPSAKPGLAALR